MIKRYLRNLKWKRIIKQSGLFDEKYYLLTYEDVRKVDIDPIMHYIKYGAKEGRNPNADFDTNFYLESNPDVREKGINPLIHYILYGKREKNRAKNRNESLNMKNIYNDNYFEYLFNILHSKKEFVKYKRNKTFDDFNIKAIAFYLPQFHPIPENDKWWGKGFTEWTNVTKAIPQYIGHHQPHLPYDLGFYDLRLEEVMQRQVDLAKNYGIYGFCFHFYWFNGKRVLEKPLELFADKIDFPFCINWANENWTRKWDGLESDILLKQEYSPEDDIEFIKEVSKLFKKKNYIKIGNKPLLMIYRPNLFPDIKKSAERWRIWCKDNGVGEIFLALTHSFEIIDPQEINFDAAVEFPPNRYNLKPINKEIKFFNKKFNGSIYSYDELILKNIQDTEYKYTKFKSICPGWDNEARKPGEGISLYKSTPEKYKKWLNEICKITLKKNKSSERLIFVNAWNEWAEGAHLEPDQRYGYAYLQATYDVLKKYNASNQKIVYVSHDANMHGAQLLSLNIVKTLKEYFNFEIEIIIKKGGELEKEFKKFGDVYNLEKINIDKVIKILKNRGVDKVICSTVVSGDLTRIFKNNGFVVLTLVHELTKIIKEFNIIDNAKTLSVYSDKIVFPSRFVLDKFKELIKVDEKKTVVRPQGLFNGNKYKNDIESARRKLRSKFNFNESDFIVLGIGFADKRKGFDLFVETAKHNPDYKFVWVGNIHPNMAKYREIASNLSNIVLAPQQMDIDLYYAGADLYLLTSREDPFPCVVLEAMNVGLPVIAFKNAGGFIDIVKDRGVLVEYENIEEISDAIHKIFNDKNLYIFYSEKAMKLIEEKFNFIHYVFDLLNLLGYNFKKISVIVPNYNYEKYIVKRLKSICKQTYPLYELIFLDDCSSDDSLKVAKNFLRECKIPYKIISNKKNSGSVFIQWSNGIQKAIGDYIWIAEADDYADKNFVKKVIKCFDDKEVVFAYSQSFQIDEYDNILSDNYFAYTDDISKDKWLNNYIRNGKEEITDTLSIKNTVPNVSAVIFKKTPIQNILDELTKFEIAGDWYFYVWILEKGKICYISESLNYHRRHSNSVTIGSKGQVHFKEIVKMQDFIINKYKIMDQKNLDKIYSYRKKVKSFLGIEK